MAEELITVEIDCEMERCGNCHLGAHGSVECFCRAYEIMLEPDPAEQTVGQPINVFFRCQKCLSNEMGR